MNYSVFITSASITFVYIFLKAMQQLNVVHDLRRRVMLFSLGMGMCEVAVVLLVVRADTLWLGVANGIAGGLGALSAMAMHKRMRNQ